MDYLRPYIVGEEHGLIEFDIEVLKGALELPDLEQEYKDALKKDIAWAKAQNDTVISYLCF